MPDERDQHEKEVAALVASAAASAAAGSDYEALNALRAALAVSRQVDDPALAAVICRRLGIALERAGRIQEAVTAYESGLQLLNAVERLNLDADLHSLTQVPKGYSGIGPGLADLYSPAVADDLRTAAADPQLPATLLLHLGNSYFRQAQPDPALNAFRRALARPEVAAPSALRAHLLSSLGETLRRRKELDEAEQVLREALDLFAAYGTPGEARRTWAALARLARDRGEEEEALRCYTEAERLLEGVTDPRERGRFQAEIGRFHLGRERLDLARPLFEAAVELARQSNDDETLWHALWGSGRCRRAAGDLPGAVAAFRESWDQVKTRQGELCTDEGKITFLDSTREVADDLIDACAEQARAEPHRWEEVLRVVDDAHGRALLDLMAGHRRVRPRPSLSSDPFTPASAAPPMPPQMQMAPSTPSAHFPAAPESPETRPWVQMAPSTPSARFPMGRPLSAAPEERVPAEELARLVFHTLPDRTLVLAARKTGEVTGHLAPIGAPALAAQMEAVRRALRVDAAPDTLRGVRSAVAAPGTGRGDRQLSPTQPQGEPEPGADPLASLYELLVEPVAAHLPDGERVALEPHGPLWLLPFAALRSPVGGWLADRWPLLCAPSDEALRQIRTEPDYGTPATLQALIVGNPDLSGLGESGGWQFSPLPGAETEAREIAALLPEARRTLLLGAQAGRDAVLEAAAGCGILHLATHGIALADDPHGSFVALAPGASAEGRLTARDVLSRTLPADLVTLSACQTGLGRLSGDGILGLSRSFLVAGARSVLVSLWSVDDDATRHLMTAFYRHYLTTDDKAISLQRAMQEVREQARFREPRYWAPFLLVGAEA